MKKKIKLRKVLESLKIKNRGCIPVSQIVKLYSVENHSIKALAKEFLLSQKTIRTILIENNIKLKTRGEINHLFKCKFPKPKVLLDETNKAYISGLLIGDFAISQRSEYVIRISTGTTIPAFIDMVFNLFSKYGHIIKTYDKYNKSYKISVDLDFDSFKFFLYIKKNFKFIEKMSKGEFIYFLAGFIDAEGTIGISKRAPRNQIEFQMVVYNTNIELLQIINLKLRSLGFASSFIKVRKIGKEIYKNKIFNHNFEEYKVSINRKYEIQELLKILPINHPNKKIKKELILYLIENKINRLDKYLEVLKSYPLQLPIGKNLTTGLEIPAK